MDMEYKPSLYLDSSQLPEIKKWEVGETYDVILTVKMTSIRIDTSGKTEATLEVQSAISGDNDPMELGELSGIGDNNEFLRASAGYRQKNGK